MSNSTPKWFAEFIPNEIIYSTLFKFTILVPGNKKDEINRIEIDMLADLDIDYAIIQKQLEDTPSQFAYWAAIYSEIKMQVNKIERMIKHRRAFLISQAVKEASQAQVKITVKQSEAVAEADEEIDKLESKLLLLEKNCGKLYYMIEAIRMKHDTLRSLAGFAKQEMHQSA